jgi:hypothetical protein
MTRYNVVYTPDTDLEALKLTLVDLGVDINEEFLELHVLNITAPDTSFSDVAGIVLFEEDKTVTVAESSFWHLQRLSSRVLPMQSRYTPRNDGEEGVVYLVDSGVDVNHQEFSEATFVNLHSYTEDFSDETGHGTAMASLIVGNTLGASKKATVKIVKIPMGTTILSVLLSAFNHILEDHQSSPGVKVVNCSWTIAKSMILDMKIQELQDEGLVVVAAAGNTGEAADNFSPVGLDTVIGVAASDAYDRVISWAPGLSSNWGPEVDLTAPGVEVDVASIHSETGYAISSGTSISSALVSAVICQHITDGHMTEGPEQEGYDAVLTAERIKNMIVLPPNSSQDMLFRNESIYGTTPNRLVHALYVDTLVENIKDPVFIKAGETTTFTLDVSRYVDTINVHNVKMGARTHEMPEWAEYDDTTRTFTFAPSADHETQRVVLMFQMLKEDEELGIAGIDVRIYREDVSECETLESYHMVLREDDEIKVMQASGFVCTGDCTYWAPCSPSQDAKGAPCLCTDQWSGWCYPGEAY